MRETKMKKREYDRPQMKVREMRQRTQLLAGSEVNARMSENFEEEDW